MKKSCSGFLFPLLIVAVLAVLTVPKLVNSVLKWYYPQSYSEIVLQKAEQFDLDPNLVYAVIHAESKFDDDARSHAGATGLMQLTPETFDWINSQQPSGSTAPNILNPEDNIHAGCALLRLLLDRYGDLNVALCAYNAGMGNVGKWLKNETYSTDGRTLVEIPFPETKKYTERVQKNYELYQKLYG